MLINLHNHTDNSYDGLMTSVQLVQRAKEFGQEAVAITDHGTMSGTVEFYKAAKKAGIKPIIGLEAYIYDPNSNWFSGPDQFGRKFYHLVLLAMNQTGLKNLYKLCSDSFKPEHFYHKPRVSLAALEALNEGIWASSACLGGWICKAFFASDRSPEDKYLLAKERTETLARIFKDRFSLEVQEDDGSGGQTLVNNHLFQLSKEVGLPVICASDAHYCYQEDADVHKVLLGIKTGVVGKQEDAWSFTSDIVYLKSEEHMLSLFPKETVDATAHIASLCNVEIELNKTHYFPELNLQEGPLEALRSICTSALDRLLQEDPSKSPEGYKERMEMELGVIEKLGFASYFLLLREIILHCKEKGILIGVGRGSSGGSLVAYLTEIIRVDPVKYGLLFERFLHENRVSMVDIDTDVEASRREEVVLWIKERWGEDKVCLISNRTQLKPKSAIWDVCRVLGKPLTFSKALADLIPPGIHGKELTLEESIKQEPKLADDKYEDVISLVGKLEGVTRQFGTHAAGICVSPIPLTELIPTRIKDGLVISQFTKDEVEEIGLIKLDLLGLRNLTIVNECCKKLGLDPYQLPEDDPEVYKAINEGLDLTGIFQFEGSAGMGSLLRKMKPETVGDLSIVTAVFRPGALGSKMDQLILNNKFNLTEVKKTGIPQLDEILRPTYYGFVYQEQLIEICKKIAGFSPTMADETRKLIGKKLPEKLAKIRPLFIDGCAKTSGLSEEEARGIFEYIENSASYAFNASHSFLYSILSFHTAWLKTHHPAVFMAEVLNASTDEKAKLLQAIKGCRASGLELEPPDLRLGNQNFVAKDQKTIMFGLSGVKHFKKSADFSEHELDSISQVIQMAEDYGVNAGKIKALIDSGALDYLGKRYDLNRSGVDLLCKDYIEYRKKGQAKLEQFAKWEERKKRRAEQEALKAKGEDYGGKMVAVGRQPVIPDSPDPKDPRYKSLFLHPYDKAVNEHDALGFNITGSAVHYVEKPSGILYRTIEEISQADGVSTLIAYVSDKKETNTRNKTLYAILTLEDDTGIIEAKVTPTYYVKVKEILDKRMVVLLSIRKEAWREEESYVVVNDSIDILKINMKSIRTEREEEVWPCLQTGVETVFYGRFALQKERN